MIRSSSCPPWRPDSPAMPAGDHDRDTDATCRRIQRGRPIKIECPTTATTGNATISRVSRQSGHLWLAGEHDVVPVAEHKHLRRAPNDAFQIYHGPHA